MEWNSMIVNTKLRSINERITEWAKWAKKDDKFLYYKGTPESFEKILNTKIGKVKLEEYTDKEYFNDFWILDQFTNKVEGNNHYIICNNDYVIGDMNIDWEDVLKQTYVKKYKKAS